MYLEMIGAACSYLLELDIEKYLIKGNYDYRTKSLLTLEDSGLRYNESFTFTDLQGPSSLPKKHIQPESPV